MDDDPGLPMFRYHPEPMRTGSAVRDPKRCTVCGIARGVIYDGPIYAGQADALCLDCISSGDAARVLGTDDWPASFTDVGWGVPDNVPASVRDEIAHRTPGFTGWQQEHWLYHCGDGTAFLGRVGYEQVAALPDALEMLMQENLEFGWTEDQTRQYVESLTPDGDATAYLFRCLHCGRALAYSDMS